jgi:hypothetical protein
MKYLEKLLKTFQDTPQNIILHADILRRGIKLNDDLKRAGKESCQTGIATKLQYVIMKEKDLPPSQFHFKSDETTVDIKVNKKSPYEIKEFSKKKFQLYCGDKNFGEVRFTKRPKYADKKTSDGQDCQFQLMQRGSFCLLVSPIDMCAYFKKGEACKYCILSPAMDIGIKQNQVKAIPDYNILAEAVAIACEEDVMLRDLKLSGGALYDIKKEAKYYKKCLEAILERIDPPEEITIFSQAFDKEDQKDLKEMGATNTIFNLEVWDERLWPKLLPGKSKSIGREKWIKHLEDAVDVFGRGHVGSSFVGGFECAPKPGFLTQDEAFESYLTAFEFLLKRDIVPWFTIWTPYPLIGGFKEEDPPETEWYLQLGQKLHELLEKYDMYKDLGFPHYGINPPTLGLYCYYCFSMQFTRDYPRLINRRAS